MSNKDPQVNVNVTTGQPVNQAFFTPLFPNANGLGKNIPAKMRVTRIDPADGYLGEIPPDSDEEGLRALHGGGFYELKLVNATGQLLPGGVTKVKINGEPRRTDGHAAQAPAAQGIPGEMFAWMRERQKVEEETFRQRLDREREEAKMRLEEREKEAAARLRERESEVNFQITRLKAEQDAKETAAKSAHDRDMERLKNEQKASAAEAEARWQMFMTMQSKNNEVMIEALKANNVSQDPTAMIGLFTQGFSLASGIGKDDPGVAIVKQLTEGFGHVATLYREDNRPGQRAMMHSGRPQRRNGAPLQEGAPAPTESTPKGDKITRIKAKAGELLKRMMAEGHDPEEVLGKILSGDVVLAPREAFEDDDEPEEEAPKAPGATAESPPEPVPAKAPAAPSTGAAVRNAGGADNGGAQAAPVERRRHRKR